MVRRAFLTNNKGEIGAEILCSYVKQPRFVSARLTILYPLITSMSTPSLQKRIFRTHRKEIPLDLEVFVRIHLSS